MILDAYEEIDTVPVDHLRVRAHAIKSIRESLSGFGLPPNQE